MLLIFLPLVWAATSAADIHEDCPCGRRNGDRIINGQDADPNEWPWQVFVINAAAGNLCGGSLISERWVATAGHCVDDAEASPSSLHLGLGLHEFPSSLESFVTASQVIRHPQYDDSPVVPNYDYALVELSQPVEFSETVRPICLPDADDIFEGRAAVAAGWGDIIPEDTASDYPSVLQETFVTITADAVCTSFVGLIEGLTSEDKICSFETGTGVCQGDSGGSLMYEGDGDGRYYLAGVTSFVAVPCGSTGFPDAFARVAYVLPWIEEVTAANPPCQWNCAIDGAWGQWDQWSGCSGGTKQRSRSCNDPAPKCDGLDCPGDSVEIEACQEECSDECVDRLETEFGVPYCSDYAAAGYCETNPDVAEYCEKTCGVCSECEPGDCVDKLLVEYGVDYCDSYAAQGYCEDPNYAEVMEEYCNKACGYCQSTDCEDTLDTYFPQYAGSCPGWAAAGHCTHQQIQTYCEASCGLCGDDGGPPCEDTLDTYFPQYAGSCPGWAAAGQCVHQTIQEYCQASCDLCDGERDGVHVVPAVKAQQPVVELDHGAGRHVEDLAIKLNGAKEIVEFFPAAAAAAAAADVNPEELGLPPVPQRDS